MVKFIEIKGKQRELKFTFNSFKYMEEFDVGELETVETKPFKLIAIIQDMLFGAVNNDKKQFVPLEDVEQFLETYIDEEKPLDELFTILMEKLQDSGFFKSLQKKVEQQKK